jgi:hypothetical protein
MLNTEGMAVSLVHAPTAALLLNNKGDGRSDHFDNPG